MSNCARIRDRPAPTAARTALLDAYHAGFSSAFNTIVLIGAVIALIGSIGAFALVRQRDFVPSGAPPRPPAGAHTGADTGLDSGAGTHDAGAGAPVAR